MQKLLNNEQADIKKVKEMLSSAYSKQVNFEGIIKKDIQHQEDKLNERIRSRRLKSEGKRNSMASSSPDFGSESPPPNSSSRFFGWFSSSQGVSGK